MCVCRSRRRHDTPGERRIVAAIVRTRGKTAMNRRQMMKAFPGLAAAATAVAHAMPAEAQAVTPQTAKASPAYKGRLRPGVIALSYRPQLEAKEMTYEDIVRVIADLGLEGMEMTAYWLPPMLNFPAGTP